MSDARSAYLARTAGGTQTAPSQNFGSNVVIGGGQSIGPAGMGGASFTSSSQPSDFGKAEKQAQERQQEERLNKVLENILGGEDKEEPKEETLIQKVQGVLTGDEIKRLSPDQLRRAQDIINRFEPLNLNPFQLRTVMISNLFGGIFGKDQTFRDEPGPVGMPMFTREGVLDQLGSDTLQSLERFAPDLIFGTDIGVMPATSGGLLNLANNQTAQAVRNEKGIITGYITADGREISKEQGDKYNNAIFAARAELDRMGKNTTTGTSNQGIMAASPALPGLPVRPPVTPPGTTSPAQSPIPAPVPNIITQPFDINKFYASLPQYSRQGIMSPNLGQFYQNLGMFPGMA